MSEPLTILGWPHAPDGSGYYRFYLPFEYLARFSRHRIAIPSPDALPYHPDEEAVEECDVIVGQRWMYPKGVEILTKWQDKTRLVYEVDDDILNPDTASGLPHLFDEPTRETIKTCLRLAHMVTVSTEPLAEALRPYNDNIRIVPNQIHADMLYLERPRRDRLVVGWSGGMSHLQDWMVACETVGNVLRGREGTEAHFMGIDYSPMLKLPADQTRHTPWNPQVWTFWTNIDFDIGLAPLADTAFNRAKSYIRALEYMALGIPVIASDCPAYEGLVVHGKTGFLARTENDWRTYLTLLLQDEDAREEMGAAGKEIAAGYVVQSGWKNWIAAYEAVL